MINRVINFYSNVYYLFAFVIIYSNVYYLFGKFFNEFLSNLKMHFEIKKRKPSLTLATVTASLSAAACPRLLPPGAQSALRIVFVAWPRACSVLVPVAASMYLTAVSFPPQPPSRLHPRSCCLGRPGSAGAWWCGQTSRSYRRMRPAAAGSPMPSPSALKVSLA
jgi:tellurite resistance protein TehA-like permease